MTDLFADLLRFIRALWKEWVVLLTGSSLAAILVLWKLAGQRDLPGNLAWFVIVLTFAFACFLVWRREYRVAREPRVPRQVVQASEQTIQQVFAPIPAVHGILVDQSLKELVRPYEEHTTIEADRLMSVYIGKRLKVAGEICEISKGLLSPGHEVLLYIDKIFLALEFGPEWDERLLILHKGQPFSAIGKIRFIRASKIQLEQCEMLPSPPTQLR